MADEFQDAHSIRVRQCDCGVTAHIDLIDEDGDIFAGCSVDREHVAPFVVAICRAAGVTPDDMARAFTN